MTLSAFSNIVVVCSIYVVLGCCSFFVFGDKTEDNVLKNFLPKEIPATIAKFGLGIQLTIV
jgi:amino acid permease